MTVSDDQGIASFLREGDYFVVGSNSHGLTAEYAPDAPRHAPITGAFAALRGHLVVWDAEKAAEILENKAGDSEMFLLRELRRQKNSNLGEHGRAGLPKKGKDYDKEPLRAKIDRLLVGFAEEYKSDGGLWEGWLPDFHAEIINKLHPCALDSTVRGILSSLDKRLPGIRVDQQGKGFRWLRLRVDWELLAAEAYKFTVT
jgi:hypothetical protein